jgi:hypothetical protein
MTTRATCIGILILAAVIVGLLYVAFGQLTVRKLRKNPATKNALGLEYVSGWDIINVAQALAFPKSWNHKLESSPLSFMHAKASTLYQYTNRLDRILGFLLYWLLTLSGLACVLLVIFNALGMFENH